MSKAPSYIIIDCLRADFGRGNYRKAFMACRKHRIDLNVIVDHDRETFMRRLASFVEQVDDVDHINLFLTNLGRVIQIDFHFLNLTLLSDEVRRTQEPLRISVTQFGLSWKGKT